MKPQQILENSNYTCANVFRNATLHARTLDLREWRYCNWVWSRAKAARHQLLREVVQRHAHLRLVRRRHPEHHEQGRGVRAAAAVLAAVAVETEEVDVARRAGLVSPGDA